MSDWEFLYEMNEQGYSPEEIADAAAAGLAPWEFECLSEDWIESQLSDAALEDAQGIKVDEPYQSRDGLPFSILEQTEIFQDLVNCAERHFNNTGRYLQVWGELGEIYAEIRFGLRRHGTHTAGSDGTIAGKLVEVKTISPEKTGDQVLIVRIDQDFKFRAKLIDRSEIKEGAGKYLKVQFKAGDVMGLLILTLSPDLVRLRKHTGREKHQIHHFGGWTWTIDMATLRPCYTARTPSKSSLHLAGNSVCS